MSARTSRTLAAIVAAAMAVGGLTATTATTAFAAGACTPGETQGVQAGDGIGPLQVSLPGFGYVNAAGRAYGSADHFTAQVGGLGSATSPATTVNSLSGPSSATVDSTASGVTATGQDLGVVALPHVGHASVQIAKVTGPVGSTAFTDPAAARTALDADGSALATVLTDALPGVQAALAGDPSPEAAAFIAAMQAAATAAPTASAAILDGPAFTVSGLFASYDATPGDASTVTTVGSVTVGGVLAGSGFLSGGSIDLVDGAGANAALTDNTPTWTLLGLPVVESGVINAETVDVTSLDPSVRPAVQAALAGVDAALQQLTRDAGLFAGLFPGGPWPGDPGFLRSTSLAVNLGGGANATGVVLGGSTVQTICSVAPAPTPTATPSPTPTATPTPTPTKTVITDPFPPVQPVVKPAPRPTPTKVEAPQIAG